VLKIIVNPKNTILPSLLTPVSLQTSITLPIQFMATATFKHQKGCKNWVQKLSICNGGQLVVAV